jgi:hypothetical protein
VINWCFFILFCFCFLFNPLLCTKQRKWEVMYFYKIHCLDFTSIRSLPIAVVHYCFRLEASGENWISGNILCHDLHLFCMLSISVDVIWTHSNVINWCFFILFCFCFLFNPLLCTKQRKWEVMYFCVKSERLCISVLKVRGYLKKYPIEKS